MSCRSFGSKMGQTGPGGTPSVNPAISGDLSDSFHSFVRERQTPPNRKVSKTRKHSPMAGGRITVCGAIYRTVVPRCIK